jgi:hypothetical protein
VAQNALQAGAGRWQLCINAGQACMGASAVQPGKSFHATGTQRDCSRVMLPCGGFGGAVVQAASVTSRAVANQRLATRCGRVSMNMCWQLSQTCASARA